MIIKVDDGNIQLAAEIHAKSWRESHRSFCSEEFINRHTSARQAAYLRDKMRAGEAIYMLVEDKPVGVVAVDGNLIEDLYILPEEQRKGYGTKLLKFAMERCEKPPVLWILSNNQAAYALYSRYGFQKTGRRKQLSGQLFECEMTYENEAAE